MLNIRSLRAINLKKKLIEGLTQKVFKYADKKVETIRIKTQRQISRVEENSLRKSAINWEINNGKLK